MVFPVVGGTQDTGYDIDNSLLSNGANQSLSISSLGSSSSNAKKWTVSFWAKLGPGLTAHRCIFSAGEASGGNYVQINFTDEDRLQIYSSNAFGEADNTATNIKTTALYRDISAWYNVVWAIDTTQGTEANRIKLYVNGSQITSFETANNYPAQNTDNDRVGANNIDHFIGKFADSSSQYFDGYLSDIYFIDGDAKAASDFGKTNDNGVWIPIKYTGSFGNNGFKLEFKQSGTSANSSGIGADTSGNDNHFSVSNHGSNSTALDTPTNNFCTLNSLIGTGVYTTPSYGAGNLTFTTSSNTSFGSSGIGTIAPSSGKWYWEARINTSIVNGVGLGARVMEGYYPEFNNDSFFAGNTSNSGGVGYSVNFNNGHPQTNSAEYNTGNEINGGSALSANDIIGVAMDLDNGAIYYAINGTWQASSDPESGSSKTNAQHSFTVDGSYAPGFYGYGTGSGGTEFDVNFGGGVSFNVSSATSDTAGYGKFEYSVPDGYYALNTKNLGKYG